MTDELAPYAVQRYYDGEAVWYHLVRDMAGQRKVIWECYETREDAVHERNRLNSAHAMDTLGIF
jgi:hypothetical protein